MAKCFVGVTGVLAHSFPTTHILENAHEANKGGAHCTGRLHFIPDGPSSQYWNRLTCDMVAHFFLSLRPHGHGSIRGT